MNQKVIFSTEAYNSLIHEVSLHKETETGGIFLGHQENNIWYIIEMIDPGYQEVTREYSYFEYDKKYVEHLSNIISEKYQFPLLLLGLWHRHPGSMDTFSTTDDETNKKFAKLNLFGAISALVNIDPNFRLTIYHVPHSTIYKRPKYKKILDVKYGNEYIPKKFIEKVDLIKDSNSYILKDIDSDITEKLFTILDIELDFLENQSQYQFEINPIDFKTNSIAIKLNIINYIDNYPETISIKLHIINSDIQYIIKANDSKQQEGIYFENLIKSFIEKYIQTKEEQINNFSYSKEENIKSYEYIEIINNYLKFFQYDSLLIDIDFNLNDLKKIKRKLMYILHTDKKDIDESNEETYKIDEIAKNINNAIDYLEKLYKSKRSLNVQA